MGKRRGWRVHNNKYIEFSQVDGRYPNGRRTDFDKHRGDDTPYDHSPKNNQPYVECVVYGTKMQIRNEIWTSVVGKNLKDVEKMMRGLAQKTDRLEPDDILLFRVLAKLQTNLEIQRTARGILAKYKVSKPTARDMKTVDLMARNPTRHDFIPNDLE